jgi:hypothetical protein
LAIVQEKSRGEGASRYTDGERLFMTFFENKNRAVGDTNGAIKAFYQATQAG